jgi:hypothetical protein
MPTSYKKLPLIGTGVGVGEGVADVVGEAVGAGVGEGDCVGVGLGEGSGVVMPVPVQPISATLRKATQIASTTLIR